MVSREVNVIERKGEYYTASVEYDLLFGSKQITLTFIAEKNLVITYVKNILPEEVKIPNETTTLYEKVKEICQNLANKLNIPIQYMFTTKSTQMNDWAVHKGTEIMQWEEIRLNKEQPEFTEYLTTFYPNTMEDIK